MTAIANMPDLRPSLLMDFANSGRVDPRLQCTRASAATCYGPDGKLRTVAANVPRIDYDPLTRKCLGLLVEDARTNLSRTTGSFSSWAVSDATLQASTVIAPLRSDRFSALIEGAAAAVHGIREDTAGLIAGTVYTRSLYVAYNGTVPFVQLQMTPSGGALLSTISRIFNLRTGEISGTQGAIVAATAQRISDTVWRISLSVRADADGGVRTWLYLNRNGSSTDIYAGDGVSSVLIWGHSLKLATPPVAISRQRVVL